MLLQDNTTALQNLLNQANALPDAGRVELPTLTDEGSASELLNGKQLIDQEGNVVTGIFTIDANKKTRVKTGKVIKLKKLETLPLEEVLSLTMTLGPAMDIILGLKEDETREIKRLLLLCIFRGMRRVIMCLQRVLNRIRIIPFILCYRQILMCWMARSSLMH